MRADPKELEEEAQRSTPEMAPIRYREGGEGQVPHLGVPLRRPISALQIPEDDMTMRSESLGADTLLMAGRERPLGDSSGVFDSDPPPSSGPTPEVSQLPVIDPVNYDIIGEFARGGLGRILRARDRRLGRPVALKVLLESGREIERRFVREAVVTSRLQHPGIVPIYEAGRFPDGTPFYAMRLVLGEPLAAVLRRATNLPSRLALLPHVVRAAEAIAYAHSRRVIHRDIKPENILVGGFGETVVIDWGFAKNLTAEGEPEDTVQRGMLDAITRAGAVLGTPTYMAPEQARGKAVDERVDVYAIGAILYRILSGRRPYDEVHPARVLKLLGEGPPPALAPRAKGAPEELIAVADKAMARRPQDRYPSARELAEDLRRFQAGQLVGAHQYTQGQLLRRWLRRHAAAVIATTTVVVVLSMAGVAGLRGVFTSRDRLDRERREALAAQAQAEKAEAEALARADDMAVVQARGIVSRDPTEAIAWLKRLSPHWTRWDTIRPLVVEAHNLGIAEVLRGHQGRVGTLSFSPDGASLASGSADNSVRVWALPSMSSRLLTGSGGEVTGVAFSPSGAEVAATSKDGAVRIWTLASGSVRALIGHETMVLSLAFSPDGQRLAVGGASGAIEVWDLGGSSSEVFKVHRGGVTGVAFMSEGRLLLSAGVDGVIAIQDLVGRQARMVLREPVALCSLAFSPDGHHIAYGGEAGLLRLRDLSGERSQTLLGHQEGRVCSLGFSENGRLLVSAGTDRTVRVWDFTVGSSGSFLGNDDAFSAALSPDGATIARGGGDGLVRLFRSALGGEVPPADKLRGWLATVTRAEIDGSGKLTAATP